MKPLLFNLLFFAGCMPMVADKPILWTDSYWDMPKEVSYVEKVQQTGIQILTKTIANTDMVSGEITILKAYEGNKAVLLHETGHFAEWYISRYDWPKWEKYQEAGGLDGEAFAEMYSRIHYKKRFNKQEKLLFDLVKE